MLGEIAAPPLRCRQTSGARKYDVLSQRSVCSASQASAEEIRALSRYRHNANAEPIAPCSLRDAQGEGLAHRACSPARLDAQASSEKSSPKVALDFEKFTRRGYFSRFAANLHRPPCVSAGHGWAISNRGTFPSPGGLLFEIQCHFQHLQLENSVRHPYRSTTARLAGPLTMKPTLRT